MPGRCGRTHVAGEDVEPYRGPAVTASAAIMHGLGSEKVKVETQSVVDYLTGLSRKDIPVEALAAGDAIH
jgi:hypothetical protein